MNINKRKEENDNKGTCWYRIAKSDFKLTTPVAVRNATNIQIKS